MFPFITKTWNPLCGQCFHDCCYCWAKSLIKRHAMPKYVGRHRLDEKQMRRRFNKGDFVFVQDMSDLFAITVPHEMINKILEAIRQSPEAQFLLLTKNPRRYGEFDLPENTVAGATIETDIQRHLTEVSPNAPSYNDRLVGLAAIDHPTMISIEPIMAFSYGFLMDLIIIKPDFVAIGFDNYNNNLPEPSLKQAEGLAEALEELGFKVYRKTMRDKHD